MHLKKHASAILLGLVFIISAIIGLHNWRTDIINYDNIHDLENAAMMVNLEGIPDKGGVASFGVINPPGIAFGLVPGVFFFPDEPDLAIRTTTVFLTGLIVLGLYLLFSKRFSPNMAFWACLIYLLSSTGWYFLTSLRPRAHPVFLVWVLYFCDLWMIDRKKWAILPLAVILSAGLYWMLEIAPLALAVVLLVLVFRPEFHWKWTAWAVGLALVVWTPYLKYEWDQDFHDLKYLLIKQERAHDFWQLYLTEFGIAKHQATMNKRAHSIPGYTPAVPPKKPEASSEPYFPPEIDIFESFREIIPKFNNKWPVPLVLGFSLVACFVPFFGNSRIRLKEIFSKTLTKENAFYLMILSVFIVCWPILFIMTKGEVAEVVEKRFFWLWALQGPFLIAGIYLMFNRIFRKPAWKSGGFTGLAMLLAIGMAMNPLAQRQFNSWKSNGYKSAREIEFHTVINDVARLIKDHDLPPRIGYDRPFLPWVVAVHQIDGVSSLARQLDVMFKFRHGITNLNEAPFCISPNDSVRIVEHFSRQPWRQTYLDLTDYPEMELWKQYKDYTVLIRPDLKPIF